MAVQISGNDITVPRDGSFTRNVTIGGTLTYEDVTNIDSVGIITARSGIEIGASPGVGASISVDGNAIFSGITTATTLRAPTGIVTSLIANTARATTGIVTTLTATTGIVTTFVTNTAKVGAAVTISESGIEASGIGITCASINGSQIGGRRNIIINGAMRIAQRAGDNIVTTNGYGSVDRFAVYNGSTDEAPSHNRQDGNSGAGGDNPFLIGLSKSLRIRNGNQTSGAQAGSYIFADYRFEAIQMRNCGWSYTSPSSFVTLSFYVKSGVAQTYYGHIKTSDGTAMNYPFDIPVAAADTWYRIVKKIPGHANLQFDSSNDIGFRLTICPFMGTTYTGSTNAHEWSTYASGTRTPDQTSTWYTTNDATFLITGVQLEVGGQVTPFEQTSDTEEINECFRYYRLQSKSRASGRLGAASNYVAMVSFPLSPPMRNTPAVAMYGSANYNSNVSSVATVNIATDHVGFIANISDGNYYYYNNGWTADAEL